MSDTVTQWLDGLELGEYAETFAGQKIVYEDLAELNESDLKDLGIPLGPRKRILKAIVVLADAQYTSTAAQPDLLETDKRLAAWERHPGERKPVTMLFADITGSTALTERLDAEDSHELLYSAIQYICEAVERNRGTVCKVMGDGVMAMFGAPISSEQHAVDACEAALDMQQSIRNYTANNDSHKLSIRVGLHSGEIVVLTVGEGEKIEYDASGPTVHIAARIEQAAVPGEVFLTGTTQLLCAQRIETITLAPISVKGITTPIKVYSLRRVRSVDEMVSDATRTPFVGRRAELNQFSAMLDTCIEDNLGQTIYIRGEPGIGKTRLVKEFMKIASEKGAQCYQGLVLPFGVGKGRDAIRSLVKSLLGIPPESSTNALLLAAENTLNEGRIDANQVAFLYDLLDLTQPLAQKAVYDAMDNTTRNLGKRTVVSALVTAISKQQPVVIIVEDVHWANALTLAHLSTLTKTVANCPAQLVMTSRIEGDQLNQNWRSTTEGSPFASIDLGPLRIQDSLRMVRTFIDTSDELATNCLERAAGNPLFLEQLLRNSQEGTTNSLPDSIQSLVLARMDRLDAVDKNALKAASVIGQRFDTQALHNLLNTNDYDCHELVRHNLVLPDADGFLFTHALIQESIYSSLVKSQRRELHWKAAQCFATSDLALHAEHLEHAGDENAPEAYLEAARQQAADYRMELAQTLTERGLALAEVPATIHALRCLNGDLLRESGEVDHSIAAFENALKVAENDEQRSQALIGLAAGMRIVDRIDDALAALDQAQIMATEGRLDHELWQIHYYRGNLYFPLGKIDGCMEQHKLTRRHARDAGSVEGEARALCGLGDAYYLRGRMITACQNFDRGIDICRQSGLGRIEVANLAMSAATLLYQNRLAEAVRHAQVAVDSATNVGNQRAVITAHGIAGYSLIEMANLPAAREHFERALDKARHLGARRFEPISLLYLAWIMAESNQGALAQNYAQDAVEMAQATSPTFTGPWALGMLALVAEDAATQQQALAEGEAILLQDCVSHNYLWFYRLAVDACLKNCDWDGADHYAAVLEDYTRAEPLPWCDFYIARGRALGNCGRRWLGRDLTIELERLVAEAKRAELQIALPALESALAGMPSVIA